jgi:hypothetical protein
VEKNVGIRAGKPAKKGAISLRSDIIGFAFFLFLSFIFWYLNSMGKVIQSDIKYPYRFINMPRDRQLAEVNPAKVNLFLQGTGFSMLQLKISGNRTPAEIDLAKVPYKSSRSGEPNEYYLITSGLVQSFTNQLNPDCRITSVKPDTLFFSFKEVAN